MMLQIENPVTWSGPTQDRVNHSSRAGGSGLPRREQGWRDQDEAAYQPKQHEDPRPHLAKRKLPLKRRRATVTAGEVIRRQHDLVRV